jgi:hypothetical protein
LQNLPNTSHQGINISAILQIARYYGLYSSRTKGKAAKDLSLEKFGYNVAPKNKPDHTSDPEMNSVSNKALNQSWARLIKKVYEVDPLICPKCGHEMRVISIITDSYEVNKILEYLKRNNAPPFDKEVTKVS